MDQRDIQDQPDDLQAAIAHHEAGRLAEAERLYLRVLDLHPGEPDALNLLGVILQERGEFAHSIELLTRALQQDPEFPEALTNLARAQRAVGQFQAAVGNASRAEELDPELAEAPLILCRALLDLGDVAEAAEAGHRAATLAPGSYEAHAYLGLALDILKDWQSAATAYQAALDLQPSRPDMLVKLASVLSVLNQEEQAIRLYRRAAELAPNELPPHSGLAFALQHFRDIPGSLTACRRAIALAPQRAELWRLQASNLQALGRFDEAAASYRRSLDLDPASIEALRDLAKINRLAAEGPEVARLGSVLADKGLPLADRVFAGFGLGTLLDKTGAYDDAFASFRQANDLARGYFASQNEVFDLPKLRRDIDSRVHGFTRETLIAAGAKGNPSELPVLVVGMPRSGTTLVEQIIASHPRVHGLGETKDFRAIIERLNQQHPDVHPVMWDAAAVRRETDAHLARLRDIGGDVDRVVDKLPDNILLLGHIALLFPRVRVIVCRRDLRDVCLSCYFQHFFDPNTWSLDLADCAARASEVERLLEHWRAALPLRMLEVHYETLVADLEGQSRRLIDFLGLAWDPACLEFHKTERTVLTLSLWQVRQPLYSSSVGRWRNYRKHIGPLLAGLEGLVPPQNDEEHSG